MSSYRSAKAFCRCLTHPAKPFVPSLAPQTFIHTHLSFCAARLPRFSSFHLPAPLKGRTERREGAFNDRACEARLSHAYEACIAPAPNRCARLSALRLAVSVTADRTFHCPRQLPRPTSSGRSAPGRNSGGRTPARPPAATFHRGSGGRHPRSAFRNRPLEDAPSKSADDALRSICSKCSQANYFETRAIKCSTGELLNGVPFGLAAQDTETNIGKKRRHGA